MSKSSFFDPQTIALHTGYQPDSEHGSRAVPIYQTTSYAFQDVSHGAALFNVERGGHIYSRMTNPTVAVLEQRMAALEGGVGCVCTASGMSALFTTFASLCSAGDHIVSAAQIYGSTATLLGHTLRRFGIETTFVDVNDHEGIKDAIQENTKLLFCETIGNPSLDVADIPALAKIGEEAHLPLVVDATFSTPVLQNPISQGANVVIHSLTKWIGGSGNSIGGAIVDGGNFEWGDPDKDRQFPTVCEPYSPFHGINFYEEFGPSALSMRIRAESMRDFGSTLSPQNAFYLLQGLESLSLRMPKHVENAESLAQWLLKNEAVDWVNHPSLDSHPNKDLAKKLLPDGAGSILSFGVKGGRQAGAAFMDALQLATNLANVGDSRTLVLHPGSTTHSRMDAEAMKAAGISEDLIRVSVGIESLRDIKGDFSRGLKAAQKVAAAAQGE
ncbi:O-acetylhomoserine aminocarboxypropyltransferase/cysteine synthase family protein [uncultured Cocleimonas sp.]|uniref:O-acetylhomoserine aminocarboxypropyltransferase/cysteine synthase family protein n=1 Tax=uncultured Cocleimonas sp. TaxID=1051587 RepID=UPI00261DD02B|nr:O-acetylhomoserine aminocarboxypropyltransferase/cysteine synthase family protein [uncultured Cocleimonas sp.]